MRFVKSGMKIIVKIPFQKKNGQSLRQIPYGIVYRRARYGGGGGMRQNRTK